MIREDSVNKNALLVKFYAERVHSTADSPSYYAPLLNLSSTATPAVIELTYSGDRVPYTSALKCMRRSESQEGQQELPYSVSSTGVFRCNTTTFSLFSLEVA